nr:MAG TPA: hypothetical protein [Caudoviricetes sp.]
MMKKKPEYGSPCVICIERANWQYDCQGYCVNYAKWFNKQKEVKKNAEIRNEG